MYYKYIKEYKMKSRQRKVIKQPELVLTSEYKSAVCAAAYLGKKGYTIAKSTLTKVDYDFLKKDLFMKPQVFGANYGGDVLSEFPVYRENDKKMYIPRFYGIQRYGLPPKSEIQQGDDIDVKFSKPLRDYQNEIIGIYEKYVDTPICSDSEHSGSGGILEVPCGRGKCLGKNTPILMYDGSIKMVQDVCVGDVLMGDDSTPRNVLSVCYGRETMVDIKERGTAHSYETNMSHILSLRHQITGEVIDLSIEEYLTHPDPQYLLGYRVPIDFIQQYPPGTQEKYNRFSSKNPITEKGKELEYPEGAGGGKGEPGVPPIEISADLSGAYQYGFTYNMYSSTSLLDKYLKNSRQVRLHLLAGFMDKMHSAQKDVYRITIPVKDGRLNNQIMYLCRSLGFHTMIDYAHKHTYIDLLTTAHVSLGDIPTQIVDLTSYDVGALRTSTLDYEIMVRILGENNYYGFEIDGNRRFVLGDFTVTHNTVMALKIIADLKKKTLIIVHKEFLMNQWIERIAEFLPGAKVGKIQAQVCEVEGCDIVIGMVQTLYDKDFGPAVMDGFGLTIIDEVHRIGSEQFSKTLFKTVTPYMLGISATVERKDQLTKVLYMFIGEKIYEEKRKNDDAVCVRAIEYRSADVAFNEPEVDFRGNTKYSTMITKLCEFGPRSDFIVRVLGDLINEDPDSQIMVLCHNRSLLAYLFKAIQYRNIASVGFYVGGMKQADLQTTETKNIVLATYAMAAEALDIKTLSTLVMVTPKTDIVQSVGRILRVKHENPIIVDIVDKHDVFQNQWIQRRRFYKKCNYRIRYIDSGAYTNMSIDWTTDNKWKRVFEPKDEVSEEEETVMPFGGACLIGGAADIKWD